MACLPKRALRNVESDLDGWCRNIVAALDSMTHDPKKMLALQKM
jgi:hypothetical protein